MTLDVNKPIDQVLNAEWPSYIRENRVEIATLLAAITAANSTETVHEMGLGEFTLEVGLDIANVILEVIDLTGAAAVDLMQITDGSGGMLKIIKASDNNITVKHNASYIDLAGDTDYAMSDGNILGLINIGGDPESSINGVWYEVFRGGGSGNSEYTAINMAAGQTALVTGTDLNDVSVEIIALTADTAVNLTTITFGEAGAVKHIIALDDNITVVQNTGSIASGTFYLNSPTGVNLTMNTRDVLTITNIGGDGVAAHGYWLELNRKLQV